MPRPPLADALRPRAHRPALPPRAPPRGRPPPPPREPPPRALQLGVPSPSRQWPPARQLLLPALYLPPPAATTAAACRSPAESVSLSSASARLTPDAAAASASISLETTGSEGAPTRNDGERCRAWLSCGSASLAALLSSAAARSASSSSTTTVPRTAVNVFFHFLNVPRPAPCFSHASRLPENDDGFSSWSRTAWIARYVPDSGRTYPKA
eukprot:scaffold49115_cov62-Phaeocystis_antarctica.AAC.3